MALFKDGVAYTPEMLVKTHGLDERQWDNIIRYQLRQLGLPILTVGRDANSRKPRVAAFGRELNQWDADRQRRVVEQAERAETPRKRNKVKAVTGLTPDGKLMNSRQLKAAGLWKEAES